MISPAGSGAGRSKPGLRALGRAYALFWRERRAVIVGSACVPLSAVAILWMPLVLGDAIDGLLEAGDGTDPARAALWGAALLFAGLALAEAAIRFVARHQLVNASRRMEERLKRELVAHLETLPIAWFDRARTGDLISRLTQDVELLRFATGPGILYGGQAAVTVPAGAWLMWSLSPLVAGACLGAFAGLLLGMRYLMPRLHRASAAVQESIGAISQRAAEDFAGVRLLLAFGRSRGETAAMARLGDEYVEHNMALARLRAWVNLLIHTMRNGVVLAVVVIGALEVVAGRLTVGGLVQFLGLLGAMVWPLLATGWLLATFHRALAAAERVEELFAVEPEPRGGLALALRGEIEVRGLTFRYPGQDQPALRDIHFALAPRQKLGLVGPVGSGKSTLLALLVRLYDPPRGTVFIDGHDVCDLDPTTVRRAFAFAPQDPFLFSDTIEGNIEFGADAELDRERLATAVSASALDHEVADFEDGLGTVVGERGVTLSGGQKQRLSLARALASRRTALVLDDSLSAVDHPTERRILQRLDDERGSRTMLVAAHRLSAVRDADLILVLDRGAIVARGRHDDLLAAGGFYAKAWRRQSEHDALERGGGA